MSELLDKPHENTKHNEHLYEVLKQEGLTDKVKWEYVEKEHTLLFEGGESRAQIPNDIIKRILDGFEKIPIKKDANPQPSQEEQKENQEEYLYDFSYCDFWDDADFRSAKFTGYADFGGAKFTGKANFWMAKFTGKANFWGAKFTGYADFSDAKFTGDAKFWNVEFTGDADFKYATFTGDANFGETKFTGNANFMPATFTGNANFGEATFTRWAYFCYATFTGYVNFENVKFTGNANFGEATFTGDAGYRNAQFEKPASFGDAKFKKEVFFSNVKFTSYVNFTSTTFTGDAKFWNAEFTGVADFRNVKFTGDADFISATFTKEAYFSSAKFDKVANFGESEFKLADFEKSVFMKQAYFLEANIDELKLEGIHIETSVHFLKSIIKNTNRETARIIKNEYYKLNNNLEAIHWNKTELEEYKKELDEKLIRELLSKVIDVNISQELLQNIELEKSIKSQVDQILENLENKRFLNKKEQMKYIDDKIVAILATDKDITKHLNKFRVYKKSLGKSVLDSKKTIYQDTLARLVLWFQNLTTRHGTDWWRGIKCILLINSAVFLLMFIWLYVQRWALGMPISINLSPAYIIRNLLYAGQFILNFINPLHTAELIHKLHDIFSAHIPLEDFDSYGKWFYGIFGAIDVLFRAINISLLYLTVGAFRRLSRTK